jgi:chromosomal replication initiation ATPase DnaA
MDHRKDQTRAAIQAVKAKLEAFNPATDERQKWKLSSKQPSRPQTNNDWPPPHLSPVNLGSNLARWEAFDWDRHPKLRSAKRVIVDWYNALPDSGALVLAGDVGCGKTHLAEAVADLYGRWRIAFYEEIILIKSVQETYDSKLRSEGKIFRDLFRSDLFILDDLGTYETNNAAFLSNVYNRLFNEYLTVMSKPMLITTNIPGDQMEGRIGVRSFSRLVNALGNKRFGRYVDLFGIPDARAEGYLK